MEYVFIESPKLARFDVINTIIERRLPDKCSYLEIGVADPAACFDRIKASSKVSVDPCIEVPDAKVTFKGTSDQYFRELDSEKTFDVIFLDGLHLAVQTWKDIQNAFNSLSENGFIVIHDCNPPHWSRCHSDHQEYLAFPTEWNGTAWKAMYLARTYLHCASITVDTDEGCGIISKGKPANPIVHNNLFFDYGIMKHDKERQLGLVSVDTFLKEFDQLL